MGGSVRTFLVERLTPEEVALANEVSHVLAELRLLKVYRTFICSPLGVVGGLLVTAAVTIYADQLAAAFAIPLPPPPSGIRASVLGVGTLLSVIVGAIAGWFIGAPLFVEPRRRRAVERLNQLIFLSEQELTLAIQKLRRIEEACEGLHEMAREGHSLPLSADDLPIEVREFYPRTI